jgi:hypothetical protein
MQYLANTGADQRKIDAVTNTQRVFIGFLLSFIKEIAGNTWL